MEEIIKMADRELYKEKVIKSELRNKDIKSNLENGILEIRDELNKRIAENNNNLNNIEILEISQKLDDLIAKHLK